MPTGCSCAPWPWSTSHCVGPSDFCCLYVIGNHVVERTGLARLSDGKWPSMSGEEGRSYAGEDQTGQDGDRQDVFLDLLAPLGLSRTKYDALDLVVYPPACLESVRIWGSGEVMEVGLKEPERLRMSATA